MIIDSHTHWLPPTLMQVLERREETPQIRREGDTRLMEFTADSAYPLAEGLWKEEVRLKEMDTHGIDAAVVSATGGMPVVDLVHPREAPAVARAANEEIADLVRRHAGRFVGLATLPLSAGERAVDELEHAVAIGLKGAMLYSNVGGRMLDSDEFLPVFAAAERLDVPIQIHPINPVSGASADTGFLAGALGYLFDTTTSVVRLILRGIFDQLPALKLHLCHAGSLLPQLVGRLDQFAATSRPRVKTMSVPPSEYIRKLYTDSVCLWPPALRLALEVFSAEHVMFGTDGPYWPTAPAFATLQALELPPESLARVNSGTAVELFGIADPGSRTAAGV